MKLKKITGIVLAFAMTLSSVNLAMAELVDGILIEESDMPQLENMRDNTVVYPVEGGNIYFDPDNGDIIDADFSVTAANIPEQINGVAVKRIFNGFYKCYNLKTLSIPNTISEIGGYQFYGCHSLETINVDPSSPYFLSVDNVLYTKDMTGLIRYAPKKPDSSFAVPESVTTVYGEAFEGCDNLTTVILHDNITKFEEGVFSGCEGLTTIKIPKGLSELGGGIFQGCKNLKSIEIPGNIKTSIFREFALCTGLETAVIHKGMTSLGTYFFTDCTSLRTIAVPDTVTELDDSVFENCSDLTVHCVKGSYIDNPEWFTYYKDNKLVQINVNFVYDYDDFMKNYSSAQPSAPKTSDIKDNTIKVLLNNSALSFTQPPVIENGTTLVPMRAIFEAMGASVDWNGETQTVTSVKDSTTISLTLNKNTATVNGKDISLAVPAKLVNGSTMVPLRFVSESLGAEVNWDGASKTVTIKG